MIPIARRIELFGLALGLYATVGQVVLMREALTLSGGNELAIGSALAAWFVGVGVGALVAGAVKRPDYALAGVSLAAPLLISVGMIALRLHRAVLQAQPGSDPQILGMAALLAVGLGLGGLTVGSLFTAASRMAERSDEAPVSRIYAAEAIGSLVGGIVFTFFLSGRTSHLVALGLSGFALLATAALVSSTKSMRITLIVALAALISLSATGLLSALDRAVGIRAFALISGSGKMVAVRDSAYGRLTLGRSNGQLQLFADGRLDHVFPDPWERETLVHLAMAQHPNPRRVLISGGGPTDRLEAALAHRPDRVFLTFLDARMFEICRPFWPKSTATALSDRRVTAVQDDGRRYITNTAERFDVVIVSPRPPLSGQANRYHTLEFFKAVRNVLEPGGSMTVSAPGGANLLAPEAARVAASELATVRRVFPEVVAVPGIDTVIHAASIPGVISDSAEILAERYEKRRIESKTFSSRRFFSVLDKERIADMKRQIARWPAEINTDLMPFAYLANLQLWERSLSGSKAANEPTWTGLAERSAWIWLAAPLLAWFIWQALRFGPGRRGVGEAVFSIATTGAAGMATEMVVLYVFQATSGQLYAGLAMLVALFMFGLAVGAYTARRFLGTRNRIGGIVAELAAIGLLLASGPVLSHFLGSMWIVLFWSFMAGTVTGLGFPAMLGRAAAGLEGDERRAAAAIEASDHLGAAFGALVTGVIWLPVYGIAWTCVLFASFKVASLAGQVISLRRSLRNGVACAG